MRRALLLLLGPRRRLRRGRARRHRRRASGGAFPVKIEHALGTTTIPEEPKRIVVVGYTDQEPLLAMGIKPVGAMDWFGQGTFAKWPWERDAWGGEPPAIVSSKSYEIDFEKVAAQRPDLILGVYAEIKKPDYEKLSQIAPTVAQAKGDPVHDAVARHDAHDREVGRPRRRGREADRGDRGALRGVPQGAP